MRKRIWFACLLAMSMTFAACGSKASTEVEQEDAATVQEDTPEAEEDTTGRRYHRGKYRYDHT